MLLISIWYTVNQIAVLQNGGDCFLVKDKCYAALKLGWKRLNQESLCQDL